MMADLKFRNSCDPCLGAKVKCTQVRPSCSRCTKHGYECIYGLYRKMGRPSNRSGASFASQTEHQKQQQHQDPTLQEPLANEYPNLKGKKSYPRRQSPRNASQEHEQLPQQLLLDQDLIGEYIGTRMDENALYDAVSALSTIDRSNSNAEFLGLDTTGTLEWYPVTPNAHELDNSTVTTGLSSLEHDQNVPEWANLGLGFNLSPPVSPEPDTLLQFSFPRTDTIAENPEDANTFARVARSALGSSPARHIRHASPVANSCTSSSSDVDQDPAAMSFRLSGCCSSSPRGTGVIHDQISRPNGLFFSRRQSSVCGSTSSRLSGRSNRTESSSHTLDRSRKLPKPSSADSSRMLQCHVRLSNQLTYISGCRAADSNVPLDALLNLDSQIRAQRDNILRCAVCLQRPRREQTLMLMAMVVSKFVSLFERECHMNLSCSSSPANPSDVYGVRRGSTLATRNTHCSFPTTTRPLSIGSMQLDNTIKTAFSRHLLHVHLERQLQTVAQLSQLLANVEDKDVTYRVTRELLTDVAERVEYLLGLMALTD